VIGMLNRALELGELLLQRLDRLIVLLEGLEKRDGSLR